MIFGYIRVSTKDQNVDRQVAELEGQVDKMFIDKVSGRKSSRPGLNAMMDQLREGDVIKVMRVSRFSRSTKDFYKLLERIQDAGATLVSVKEGLTWDDSPQGKLLFTVLAVMAEIEVDNIRARTMEGLAVARAQGRVGGRPKGLDAAAKRKAKIVARMYVANEDSVREICKTVGISVTTMYRYLDHEGVKRHSHKTPERKG